MGEADLDPKNKESIDAALSQDWERALKLNLELQKSYPKNIIIFSKNGSRLGKLDPDWSDQIATALRAGSRFEAYLKSIQLIREGTSLVTVFVKETHRAGKLANKPPFPSESTDFTPYVREGTLNYLNEIVTQTDEEIDEESDITEVKESRTDVPESIERLAEAEDESNFY